MAERTPRTCVIGLDGAGFDVLDRWVAGGDMPNLAALMARGTRSVLMSTVPPATGPAWTSMTTGVGTGTHGIFDFVKWDGPGGAGRVVESGDVRVPRLWDLIGARGLRVGVVGVPVTFPAQPVNGFCLTGMLAPCPDERMAFPPSLAKDLLRRRLDIIEGTVPPPRSRAGARMLIRAQERWNRVVQELLARCAPGFFMCVLRELDRFQHTFWEHCADGPGTDNSGLGSLTRQFFRALDGAVGVVTSHYGPEATYYVVSDHGFGPLSGVVGLNSLLQEAGLLSYDERKLRRTAAGFRLLRAARRALSKLGALGAAQRAVARVMGPHALQSLARVPLPFTTSPIAWDRTVAFAKSRSDGGIWVNLKGREPYGIVEPGAQYESVQDAILQALLGLADPATGRPIVSHVWRKQELLSGPAVPEAPDVYWVAGEEGLRRDLAPMAPLLRETSWPTGTHRMAGVLVACGPHVQAGERPEARIVDVAPTVLYGMGLPVPSHMEGDVLTGLFRDDFVAGHPVARSEGEALGMPGAQEPRALSPAETEAVQARLRELGYL